MADSQQAPVNDDINAAENMLHDPSSSSVNTITSGQPQLPSHILQIIDHELSSSNVPSLADVQAYPTTAYFNKTVIPIIIEGLAIIAKERPKKPIEYLAAFLIKNRERFGESV
jgi:protein dpy-30